MPASAGRLILPPKKELFDPLLPPDDPFLTLSHAVSWIAFRHSVGGPQLSAELAIGELRDPQEATGDAEKDEAVLRAVKRLTDLGSAGKIEIRGRLFRDVLHDEIQILTEQVEQVRLADFQWFDTLDDALYRGLGLAWGPNRQESCYPRDDRHYRFVTVNRDHLLYEFPPEEKTSRRASPHTERKCSEWLLRAFADDADNRRAKPSFKQDALELFPILSERGFNRAWDSVAEGAGRSIAGAKRTN